jgi:ATP-dependent Lon protease
VAPLSNSDSPQIVPPFRFHPPVFGDFQVEFAIGPVQLLDVFSSEIPRVVATRQTAPPGARRHLHRMIKTLANTTRTYELAVLQVKNTVVFPYVVVPYITDTVRSIAAIDSALSREDKTLTIFAHMELVLDLPWDDVTEDNLDLQNARMVLDQDHYGLKDIKERIIEQLAVMKLDPNAKSPILCFVGPPGTGKTSLGQSIARALGRKFERFSLGGLSDEAKLRGHRRTYIGAMPGRIIQAMKSSPRSFIAIPGRPASGNWRE